MSRLRWLWLAPLVLLLAETAYGLVAIEETERVVLWVLLVEGPTTLLAAMGIGAFVESQP